RPLGAGRRRLAVGGWLLGARYRAGTPNPGSTAGFAGARPCHSCSERGQRLRTRVLGLPGIPVRVAAGLLVPEPTGLHLEPSPLLLHAVRLCVCGRPLGLSFGKSGHLVRTSLLHPAAVADAGLVLPAELLRQLRGPICFAVRAAL